MTRRQRIRLGVVMHLLEEAVIDLERTKMKADAEAAKLPDAKAYGGDIAIRCGVYQSAVEFNALRIRGLFDSLLEIFPSLERPEGL
jgi:hypothetical protein